MFKNRKYGHRTNPPQYSYRAFPIINETKNSQNNEEEIVIKDIKNEKKNSVVSDKDKWARADKIALGMFIITFLLAIFTALLYSTAAHDSITADTSANAAITASSTAQHTFEETKKYDSLSLKRQQNYFDTNRAYSEKNDRREDVIFNKNNQKFEIENEPILSIYDLSINDIKGDSLNIGYRIRNLTSAVIKTYKQADTIIIRNSDYRKGFIKNHEDEFAKIKTRNEVVVINNVPVEIGLRKRFNTDFEMDNNKQGIFVYFLGKIYYTSKYSKKKREYSYIFKIIPTNPPRSQWNWIYENNEDIK